MPISLTSTNEKSLAMCRCCVATKYFSAQKLRWWRERKIVYHKIQFFVFNSSLSLCAFHCAPLTKPTFLDCVFIIWFHCQIYPMSMMSFLPNILLSILFFTLFVPRAHNAHRCSHQITGDICFFYTHSHTNACDRIIFSFCFWSFFFVLIESIISSWSQSNFIPIKQKTIRYFFGSHFQYYYMSHFIASTESSRAIVEFSWIVSFLFCHLILCTDYQCVLKPIGTPPVQHNVYNSRM